MSATNGTKLGPVAGVPLGVMITEKQTERRARRKHRLAKYEVWWNGGRIWAFEAPADVDPMAVVQKTIPWRQEELEIRRIR